ncbi:MAG TPA: gephyrin-like molybdotransferase Glp [Anaerolineales bacterium]|nr:gephyrin-like molybdotransferase Glp [Anaerolineales bacterium]
MEEFLTLLPPMDALERMLSHLNLAPEPQSIRAQDALGRVLAESIHAPFPLPAFPRSTVDGYAVIAADTHGASDSLPAYLRVSGEVLMGKESGIRLDPGCCSSIHTGGMLPGNADAVVMIENTQLVREGEVEVLRAAAPGENVIGVGEDVREGELVLQVGTRLRPVEIGGISALGITQIQVARQPKVGIISSGDEIIPPGEPMHPGKVYDINTYTLSDLVREAGGLAIPYGIAADTYQALESLASAALAECDLVVLTAGSSLSSRDLTAKVIDSLGAPGVLVHGVNIRPGKPTILGVCKGKPVVGLPGNPASALMIARLFLLPVLGAMLGLQSDRKSYPLEVPIRLNVSSASGREDYIPVRLIEGEDGLAAEPLFGRSNQIFTLVKADGFVRIPADVTGISAGEMVQVELL